MALPATQLSSSSLWVPALMSWSEWVSSVPPEQANRALSDLTPLVTPKWTRYIPHSPHPTQRVFLLLDHVLEAFFGGAAGGGKSDALLMAALQYVDVPGYNAILFRRTFQDLSLPGSLLDRARDWLQGTDAKWDDREHTWRFPNPEFDATVYKGGATLTFAYLQTEMQKHRYAGADFQFIGFDESTSFSETMYQFLFSRLRKDMDLDVPLRMRSASNPGNKGHAWVKRRFITEGRAKGRVFVPSVVQDNPSLNIEEYLISLEQLDPITRMRLLKGDWDIREGGMFKREWFGKVLQTAPQAETFRTVRYWDLAATEEDDGLPSGNDPDWTVGAKLGLDTHTRLLYMLDQRRGRWSPQGVEANVKATAAQDGTRTPIRIEQEPGAAGKSLISYYTRHVLQGYSVRGVPQSQSKETRAGPFASQAEAGNIYVVEGPWLSDFLDEAEGFPNVEHDDQIDAWSGAFNDLMKGVEVASHSYVQPAQAKVVRRGDLTLRGAQYVDRD
jgi:predicted phage terminase large subunit-like protein